MKSRPSWWIMDSEGQGFDGPFPSSKEALDATGRSEATQASLCYMGTGRWDLVVTIDGQDRKWFVFDERTTMFARCDRSAIQAKAD